MRQRYWQAKREDSEGDGTNPRDSVNGSQQTLKIMHTIKLYATNRSVNGARKEVKSPTRNHPRHRVLRQEQYCIANATSQVSHMNNTCTNNEMKYAIFRNNAFAAVVFALAFTLASEVSLYLDFRLAPSRQYRNFAQNRFSTTASKLLLKRPSLSPKPHPLFECSSTSIRGKPH